MLATRRGFTYAEFLVVIAIMGIAYMAISNFSRDIIQLNTGAQDSLSAQLEGRKVLKVMVAELRTIVPSAIGSYPLESVGTSTIIFYADVNGNGIPDRVRYFFDAAAKSMKKGMIIPTGNPLTYNTASETFTTLVTSVVNDSTTPVFEYYDAAYAGATSPLVQPVSPSQVRLVKISVLIDKNPFRSPNLINLTSQVSLRNLKDNL